MLGPKAHVTNNGEAQTDGESLLVGNEPNLRNFAGLRQQDDYDGTSWPWLGRQSDCPDTNSRAWLPLKCSY